MPLAGNIVEAPLARVHLPEYLFDCPDCYNWLTMFMRLSC